MLLSRKMPVNKERRTPIRRAFGKPLGKTLAWRFPPPMASNKDRPCAGRIGVRPSLDTRIATLAGEGRSTWHKLHALKPAPLGSGSFPSPPGFPRARSLHFI